MIVVDSSALIAILYAEAEREVLVERILRAPRRLISAVTMLETSVVVLRKRGAGALEDLRDLLHELDIETIAFDETQARLAAEAYGAFGKGVDPRARLNICDCASYALAKSRGAPLLFKGNDFSLTDIQVA